MSDWMPHKPKANVQSMIGESWDIINYLPMIRKLQHSSEHSSTSYIVDRGKREYNDTMEIKFKTAHYPKG